MKDYQLLEKLQLLINNTFLTKKIKEDVLPYIIYDKKIRCKFCNKFFTAKKIVYYYNDRIIDIRINQKQQIVVDSIDNPYMQQISAKLNNKVYFSKLEKCKKNDKGCMSIKII